MKKHNEGYVLPFVLVVLVVVCLVAVSLLTASLDNLKRQQSSIDRMKDQYAAEGEIGTIKGALELASAEFGGSGEAQILTSEEDAKKQAETNADGAAETACDVVLSDLISKIEEPEEVTIIDSRSPLRVRIEKTVGDVLVIAEYELTYKVAQEVEPDATKVENKYVCNYRVTASVTQVTCVFYEVSSADTSDGGGAG